MVNGENLEDQAQMKAENRDLLVCKVVNALG